MLKLIFQNIIQNFLFGSSSTLNPFFPIIVFAANKEFIIASSVASIAAKKRGETSLLNK